MGSERELIDADIDQLTNAVTQIDGIAQRPPNASVRP
jgi:hypothetical protein